eukprot:gnl/TRDRNA2_/TRDRNA2_87113_c0_seq1.p1 gnl/TRDRNA2_/TRDRNA2_87113_c0~~gnl/TRDRNA2_/TRDRNA2_87113_c0_seq1.p1  ORF type:complete len:274 (+),score=27.24 gnl/TRDRNA2_/TRDRNA2_87113_c0_seq1:121-942(+)
MKPSARPRARSSGTTGRSSSHAAARRRQTADRAEAAGVTAQVAAQIAVPRWLGLPRPDEIATARGVLNVTVALPYTPEEYCSEADGMRWEWPELVWKREGKPDKVSLGRRRCAEDWERYRAACPKILEAADHLIRALPGQDIEVCFGDVLDYREGHLLGWHQDSMDLTRHTFTVVMTLAADGEGRFEWREIAADGQSLGQVVSSTRPAAGDVAIHGLECNNCLAHRVFWDVGRRVTLVLFCRSDAIEAILRSRGVESNISMRHWWTKSFETVK